MRKKLAFIDSSLDDLREFHMQPVPRRSEEKESS